MLRADIAVSVNLACMILHSCTLFIVKWTDISQAHAQVSKIVGRPFMYMAPRDITEISLIDRGRGLNITKWHAHRDFASCSHPRRGCRFCIFELSIPSHFLIRVSASARVIRQL